MNRLIILILSLFFLNQCSFNEGSRLWNDKEKELKSIEAERLHRMKVEQEKERNLILQEENLKKTMI